MACDKGRRQETKEHASSSLLDDPWRFTEDWDNKQLQLLKEEIENYSPAKEYGVPVANILLVGQIGAGKSSFFNSVASSIRGSMTCKATCGTTEHSLTTTYRRYIPKGSDGKYLHFRLCDTMGLEEGKGLQIDDVKALVNGHVKEGYKFIPTVPISASMVHYNAKPTIQDKIHCVVYVVDSNSVEVMSSNITQQYKQMADMAFGKGIPQVVLLTKVDKLCKEVQKDVSKVFHSKAVLDAVNSIAELVGIPRGHVLPVRNYEIETRTSTDISLLVLQTVRQMLRFADDYLEGQHELSAGFEDIKIKE